MLYRVQSTALGQSDTSLVLLPKASVLVSDKNGKPATIFTDGGGTTAANPITANSSGGFDFYVAVDDFYDLTISANGQSISERIYPADPAIIAAAAAAQAMPYADRATAESAIVSAPASRIGVKSPSGDTLWYRRDVSGTALTTADGANWSPDGEITAEHFGAIQDGATDGTAATRKALAWAASMGENRVAVRRGVLYAPNLSHAEYPDVRFWGDGKITGAFRRYVFRDGLPTPSVVPENFGFLKVLPKTDSPKVVLVGDSVATYAANTRTRAGMLTWAIENHLRNQFENLTFVNRAIGGGQWGQLNSLPASFPAEWYTDTLKPWLDYVEDEEPDAVVLSFGMNDSANISSSAIRSVIAKIKAWAKVPDIIFATNLNPSLDGDGASVGVTEGEQTGHDYAGGWQRTYAQFKNFPLLDFHRMHCMVRDGFDPVYGKIGKRDTTTAFSGALAGGLEGFLPTFKVRNYACHITINETAFGAGEYMQFEVGGNSGNNRLRVTNSGGFYQFSLFSGTDDIVTEISQVSATAIGSDTSRDFSFVKYGNMVSFHEDHSANADNIDPIFSSKCICDGSTYSPRVASLAGAGFLSAAIYYTDEPNLYAPTATDTELWAQNNAGFGEWGGSGFNHPGSLMHDKVYCPVISQAVLADVGKRIERETATLRVSDVAFANNVAAIGSGISGGNGYAVILDDVTDTRAAWSVPHDLTFSSVEVQYSASTTGGTDVRLFVGVTKFSGGTVVGSDVGGATRTLDNTAGVKTVLISSLTGANISVKRGDEIVIRRIGTFAGDDYGDLNILSVRLFR